MPGPGEKTLSTQPPRRARSPGGVAERLRPLAGRASGQLANPCPQLDGWGVTGTPGGRQGDREPLRRRRVRPPARTRASPPGKERPGWPIRLYTDFERGAPLGRAHARRRLSRSTCRPAPTATSRWRGTFQASRSPTGASRRGRASPTSTVEAAGSGAGAAAATARATDSLFVATGNAFEGGDNKGDDFTEAAGYGEQLVQLDTGLTVTAAMHPTPFAGSPRQRPRRLAGRLRPARLWGGRERRSRRAPSSTAGIPVGGAPLFACPSRSPTDEPRRQPARLGREDEHPRRDGERHGSSASGSGPTAPPASPSPPVRPAPARRLADRLDGLAWVTHAPHAADYLVAVDLATGEVRKTLAPRRARARRADDRRRRASSSPASTGSSTASARRRRL